MVADQKTSRSNELFVVSEVWRETYPGAAVGVLAMVGVSNPKQNAALDQRKEDLIKTLRARFLGKDRGAIKALPIMQIYNDYYKRFKKTYHVQLQLESIVFKGKSIPRVAALVEAMFIAELKNWLLTAGHDLSRVQKPAGIDIARGDESFIRINGQAQGMKTGDMMIADTKGIISSVIYGPDQRTKIRTETKQALFTVYAPAGIGREAVREHLKDIQDSILIVSPNAKTNLLTVCKA